MWEELLAYAIITGILGASSLFFTVSLIMFLTTDKANTARRRKWLILFIIAAVIQGCLILGIIALVVMLSMAMSHM